MGRNRIVIERVSGHGCDRDAKPGDALKLCESDGCLECRVAELVRKCNGGFEYDGCGATMTHWPNSYKSSAPPGEVSGEVVDDLVYGKRRHGTFQ